MDIKFELSDELPGMHFEVVKLLLPSPEKRAKVLGARTCRDRDELQKSRDVFSKYDFQDSVVENFRARQGISVRSFLDLYAPGFRTEVKQILERKHLAAGEG